MNNSTYWYEFKQNNSGGNFVVDDKVCHRIYIEAEDFREAVIIAESLGCYWNGVKKGIDCPCCGDRWSKWDNQPIDFDDNNSKSIEEYAQKMSNEYGWTYPDARIYYKNGDSKEIFSNMVSKPYIFD